MTGFAYIFEIFSLLLGLAIAETLSGVARLIQLRARRRAGTDRIAMNTHVGTFVPLLATIVLLHQGWMWIYLYEMDKAVEFNSFMVAAILAVIGGYYLIASLLVPADPEHWPDFDDYFFAHRRAIIGGIIAIEIAMAVGGGYFETPESAEDAAEPYSALDFANDAFDSAIWLTLIAALFVRRPRLMRIMLVVVVASQAVRAVIDSL